MITCSCQCLAQGLQLLLVFFQIRLMYFLFVLYSSLTAHPNNTSVLSELCATLSRLAVRNEFCQDICDLGGLKLMMTLLADSYESAVKPT